MKPLLFRWGLVATAALLAGCSALQIDVDVYKGPLVHDEDTQAQQLGSIALSAKSVLLLQRNTWFDDLFGPVWWQGAGALERRSRYLRPEELTQALRMTKGGAAASGNKQTQEGSKEGSEEGRHLCPLQTGGASADTVRCRQALLINDLLSAFEDRADGRHVEHLVRLAQLRRELAPAFDATRRAELKPAQLVAANEALRKSWLELAEFLATVKRGLEASTQPAAADRQLERQLASALAHATDAGVLVCVAAEPFGSTELGRVLERLRADGASGQDGRSATHALDLAFRLAPSSELTLWRGLSNARVSLSPAGCGAANTASTKLLRTPLDAQGQRHGVQVVVGTNQAREATQLLEELDDQFGKLLRAGGNGFDRGRPLQGLERLADNAVNGRFQRRATEGRLNAAAAHADDAEIKQFHDSVVDLASRMQFLAINLTVADSRTGSAAEAEYTTGEGMLVRVPAQPELAAERASFKTTLSTIANTLLVLAEDQRRQREHRRQQQHGAGAEYEAAVAAFGLEPARRYDQLLRYVDERIKAATVAEAADRDVAAARQEHEDAKARQDERRKALEVLKADESALQTLNQVLTRQAAPIEAEIRSEADPTTAQKLRDRLADYFAKQRERATPQQLRSDPAVKSLEAAVKGLELQRTAASKEEPRAQAWETLRGQLGQALAALKNNLVPDAEAQLGQASRLVVSAAAGLQLAERTAVARRGGSLDSSALRGALTLLEEQRQSVLDKMNTVRPGVAALSSEINRALGESQHAAAPGAKRLVLDWEASPGMGLRPPAGVGANDGSSALHTLDAIEAQLAYLRIQALSVEGAQSENARAASAALEALTARRERMSYIRPASTYLRSALTTRPPEHGQGLEWSSLLWATVKRLNSEQLPERRAASAARAELDRAFWDNVNQVRLSGAGLSNFAIAKDDVGNWYVKAMGTDASAMISTAKNLALYNLGGRVDTDLLRIDELRSKATRTDSDNEELRNLTAGRSSAGAAAYNSTLGVFQANHDKRVKALLDALAQELDNERLLDALAQRWERSTAGELHGKRRALLGALRKDSVKLKAHQDAALAASPPTASADEVAPTSAESLVKALRALLGLRQDLAVEIKQPTFTQDESRALADAEDVVKAEQTRLEAVQKEFDAAILALTTAQAGVAASPPTSNAEGVAAAAATVGRRSSELNAQRKVVEAAHDRLGAARAPLQEAQVVQARALEDIDLVLRAAVQQYARKHLNAVEELETAARVVTQGLRPERDNGAKAAPSTAR